jgi:hypothetical protein
MELKGQRAQRYYTGLHEFLVGVVSNVLCSTTPFTYHWQELNKKIRFTVCTLFCTRQDPEPRSRWRAYLLDYSGSFHHVNIHAYQTNDAKINDRNY